jgi:hypothetical protein
VTQAVRRAIRQHQQSTVDVRAETIPGDDGDPVPNDGYETHIRVEPSWTAAASDQPGVRKETALAGCAG